MLVLPKALNASEVVPKSTPPTKSELIQKVYQYADDYNVNPKRMVSIINCENKQWIPDLQSGLKYKKGNRWKQPAGSQEKSYGLAQIHLPDHPDVSIQEAKDADYSIEFMAKNLDKVKWSCDKRNA